MTNEKNKANPFYNFFLPSNIEGVNTLAQLALDIQWTWNHAADKIWFRLDPQLWELTHNPWVILQTLSHDRLEKNLADPDFLQQINNLVQEKKSEYTAPAWFQKNHQNSSLKCIAYFSMEFMLSEALQIYVGGLGNVAGDQLKSASDLGVPIVAVGLLYQQGYFRQVIDKYGNQQAMFPFNDPGQLPITPLRLPNGEWLRLKISLGGFTVWLRTWQVQVGRSMLYLLDSNDSVNLPMHREITSEVYGGGPDMRIKQEIVLGIGGWKLVEALGIKPEVCHMNEGHAAFVILERANSFKKETGVSFEVALAVTKAGNLFTTHTAVAAGFDHFSPGLMGEYFSDYAKNELGTDLKNILALGRLNSDNNSESFNMAYLAIRGSGAVNGVSRLHGRVSRHLFENLFPRWPKEEVPVDYITNGVHMPSWSAEISDKIWTDVFGSDCWKGELQNVEDKIGKVSDESLWQLRNQCRNDLVVYTRNRLEGQFKVAKHPSEIIEIAKNVLNSNILTLGFARRFVPYKRPNLLLHDKERFIRLLTNPEHPVQLVIAGKAPPSDELGIALIRQWAEFIEQYNLYNHVVFLSDYDMLLAEQLVQGTDVWVNTPRRPWEACGTSGMKVLANGGINLSELDGWWAEAYSYEVGWALGDEQQHGDDHDWDAAEAESLYNILENQVVPEFYARNNNGIPEQWIKRMRKSMATLAPQFSSSRTVYEYTENYYLPAAANYLKRAADKGALGIEIYNEKNELQNKWNEIKITEVKSVNIENGYFFNATIFLNEINTNKIVVELYAEAKDGMDSEHIKMNEVQSTGQLQLFVAKHITERNASDFTVRIVPGSERISVPLENNLIIWQH